MSPQLLDASITKKNSIDPVIKYSNNNLAPR